MHEVRPDCELYVPAGQDMQASSDGALGIREYVPGGHAVQFEAPADENVPA